MGPEFLKVHLALSCDRNNAPLGKGTNEGGLIGVKYPFRAEYIFASYSSPYNCTMQAGLSFSVYILLSWPLPSGRGILRKIVERNLVPSVHSFIQFSNDPPYIAPDVHHPALKFGAQIARMNSNTIRQLSRLLSKRLKVLSLIPDFTPFKALRSSV